MPMGSGPITRRLLPRLIDGRRYFRCDVIESLLYVVLSWTPKMGQVAKVEFCA